MGIKEYFMSKVEAEYEEFVKRVDSMDTSEFTDNLWELAQFKKVYDFIKLFNPLEEKHLEGLVTLDKPIETICRVHNRMPSNVYDNYLESISVIADKSLLTIECGDKVNELLVTMNNVIEEEIKIGNDVKQQEKAFKSFINHAYDIEERDAEVLLQFENPMDIIMEVSQHNKYSLDMIKDAVEYINNHDIYTILFDLNHEKVLQDSKYRHDAIESIRYIVLHPNFKSTMGWLNYFRDFNVQQGEKSIETDNLYEDFVSMLECIRGEFGSEMLQRVYDFGSNPNIKYWDICEDSLVTIAEYLNGGGDIENVDEMAQSGYFLQPYDELLKQLGQNDEMDMSFS